MCFVRWRDACRLDTRSCLCPAVRALLLAPCPSRWPFLPTHIRAVLQEQTRSFIESIVPKAQRVAPIAQSNKKGGGAGSASPGKGSPAGGLGAKEAAAKEAAAKLEAKKSKKSKAKAATAVEMCAIAEASREGSGVP